ncbi:YiiD C-terminal domain-containing protein [Chitinivorax sp. B]|uniref:YiiD C-terminal domain-containing protein n=1 Tax=Chitinivorax sp. B TaxID=2502235 RepID=UPI002017D1E1|nr:YiiD C-terminal domain-containing protein [Chitinivorax sp. B]
MSKIPSNSVPTPSTTQLERELRQQIPLVDAMQLQVVSVADERVVLQAPLLPNINPHGTVFAGSAASVAILAAWSLLHTHLQRLGVDCQLVLQRNHMEYELPINDTFKAEAQYLETADWPRFISMLQRRGRARIAMKSTLTCGAQIVAHFEGEFVALARS